MKKDKKEMKGGRVWKKSQWQKERMHVDVFFGGREYEGGEIHMQICQTQKQTVRRSGSMVRKDNSQNPNA